MRQFGKKHNISIHNTLVIDNNPHTYQHNYGNAVPIPTYNKSESDDLKLVRSNNSNDKGLRDEGERDEGLRNESERDDNYLFELSKFLVKIIHEYREIGTVRNIDKRWWHKKKTFTPFWNALADSDEDDDEWWA